MAYRFTRKRDIDPLQPKCEKKIYYSLEEAIGVAEHMKSTRYVRNLRPYRCMMCGFWHLTSSHD